MKRSLYKDKTSDFSVKLKDEEPALYRVSLQSDDFTPMEIVIGVLEKFFHKDRREAAEMMLIAQQQGSADCGLYTKDVAATKIAEVREFAISKEVPLVCSMEAA